MTGGMQSVPPRVVPPLDAHFRPASLARRAFRERIGRAGRDRAIGIALEQGDSVYHFDWVYDAGPEPEQENAFCLERTIKALLWMVGGHRAHILAPEPLVSQVRSSYAPGGARQFDAEVMGPTVYGRPFEIVPATPDTFPAARQQTMRLGRHTNGSRLGLDLGASDMKISALLNGEVIHTKEIPWDPKPQADPQYHFERIMEALRGGAGKLPRVDAIGVSAAGIYVSNQARIASLFRGVPRPSFTSEIVPLFERVQEAFHGVPLVVANDGEVTALAGSMSLGVNEVLGISMGSSQAGGYVDSSGAITTRLNEFAFVPVDYSPAAARDEWSGDIGCGANYFSQQAVERLCPLAGIDLPSSMPAPEKLEQVQVFMARGDERAVKIYQTIGVYFGYALASYAEFCRFTTVLVLGRVTSGSGGQIIIDEANEVLAAEFPELAAKMRILLPREEDKRVGQAVAAASLPEIKEQVK